MNCGLGELPLLLALVHKNMEIVAVEKEQDSLDLAANCVSVPSHLRYANSLENENIEHYDAVVLIKPTEDLIKTINEKNIRTYVIK
jgi:tRNA1(Val) A37 N6-methylase TrmN6